MISAGTKVPRSRTLNNNYRHSEDVSITSDRGVDPELEDKVGGLAPVVRHRMSQCDFKLINGEVLPYGHPLALA